MPAPREAHDRLDKLCVAGEFEYLCTDPNDDDTEPCIAWHDPAIGLFNWLMTGDESDYSHQRSSDAQG